MEPFIGQLQIFPYNFAPRGWAECLGQIMPIEKERALFTLIGNKFGGDGKTTFGLPNYKGKAPEGSSYFIALAGIFPAR
ncbi:MAG TPA: tail fiber protein [Blastocatellia bacterium]|nr:tail fiber protein [Blastocatellia bacterium]